jgi:hypothetical protein
VGQWQFPADAVASMFRKVKSQNVISIEANGTDKLPRNKPLDLYVRYTTRDGRRLNVVKRVAVAPIQDRSTHWKSSHKEQQAPEESLEGPALVQAQPSETSKETTAAEDSSPPPPSPSLHREPLRTALRDSSPRLERPVWSPERR